MNDPPVWWSWEIEISPHVLKRMVDRAFTEVDLRTMFEEATGLRADIEAGRWVVETCLDGSSWEVIVEPVDAEQVLLVIPRIHGDRIVV